MLLSQAPWQRAGLQGEQLKLGPVFIGSSSIPGSGLAGYAIMLAPVFDFIIKHILLFFFFFFSESNVCCICYNLDHFNVLKLFL